MMGSFLTRGLLMVLAYTYPAYECFKTVEKNKPEIEQLRFWCQYWILVAVLTVFERIGDAFISWLPMYSEAKLAFFVYLWYPKTRGTSYIYDSFLRPYVAKHETDIDHYLLELKAKAGDFTVLYWQKAASYGQTRVFEILQYVAFPSPPPRPAQQQNAGVREHHPPTTAKTQQPQPPAAMHQPPAPAAAGQQQEPGQETGLTSAFPTAAAQAPATAEATTTTTSQSTTVPSEGQVMEIKSAPVVPNQSADSPPPPPPSSQETVIEETIRVTRGRLRKTRAAANR